jgi:tetratricopeptide (TPR) repeat protein
LAADNTTPNSAEEWFTKGMESLELHTQDGKIQAMECFKKAVAIDPNNAEYWYHRGETHTHFDDWYSAIECYDKALAIDPNNSDYWASKGYCQERLPDQRHLAMECYDKAISVDPGKPYAWVCKVRRLEGMKEYVQAIETCERMLAAVPDYDDFAYIGIGHSLSKSGQPEKAIEYYDKVLKNNPSHHTALKGKIAAQEQITRKEENSAIYGNNEPDRTVDESKLGFAKLCMELGRPQDADKHINEAIGFDPDSPRSWRQKGAVFDKWGYYDEALDHFDKGLEIAPTDVDLWQAKADTHMNAGKFREAADSYSKAAYYEPKIRHFRWKQALALYRSGEIEEALACLAEATALDAADAMAWYLRGIYHLIQGEPEEAEHRLEEALNSQHFSKRDLQKYIPGSVNVHPEQISKLHRILEADPQNPKTWIKKGMVFFITGNHEEAQRCFRKAVELDEKYAKNWGG